MDTHRGHHDFGIPMILICSLTFGVILLLGWTSVAWTGPIIAIAIVTCISLMGVMAWVVHRVPVLPTMLLDEPSSREAETRPASASPVAAAAAGEVVASEMNSVPKEGTVS